MKQACTKGAAFAIGTVLYGYLFHENHSPDWERALFVGVFVFAIALVAPRIWPSKAG